MFEIRRIVHWLSQLIQIPSVGPSNAGLRSGSSSEAQLAAQVSTWFKSLGAHVELEDVYPGRPNVYGLWHGISDHCIAVDVHLDTVGVETMDGSPFDGRVAEGRVYGRGAVDTKATLAILLTLLESIHAQGESLPFSLLICASSDEETGAYGAAVFRDWVRRQALQLNQLIVAEPTMCAPVYGHKGSVGLVLEISGTAAHSSRPQDGKNAITAAVPVISALIDEHQRLIDMVPVSNLGTGTLSVTVIRGGQAHNVIPDFCTIDVDRRLTAGEEPLAEAERILEIARTNCTLPVGARVLHQLHPFHQDPNSALVRQISDWSGRAPTVAPFASNAWAYSGLAEEVVLFGPGSIEQAHRDVEWVAISELEKAAQIYLRWWSELQK